MGKELFNQTLKAAYSDTDHIALGIPSMTGCDNMLMSVFKAQILSDFIRSNGSVAATEGEHTVNFSSTMGTTDIAVAIIDYLGIGISYVSHTATGFTYNALTAGNFAYIAIKNI